MMPNSSEEIIYLYHFAARAFPIPEPSRSELKKFLNQLIAGIAGAYRTRPEYFAHTEAVTGEWREVLTKNASYWEVQTGLGLRPDRSPTPMPKPGEINMELFMRGVTPPMGEEELIYHFDKDRYFDRLFPDRTWPSPLDAYLGCGGVMVCLVPEGRNFLDRSRQLWAAELNLEPQDHRFYVPILDFAAFEQGPADLLERWFELFDVYLMETQTDPGVLVASRYNLDALLVELKQVFQLEDER
ncbi:MAG TPA: hypothetical protein VJ302_24495 [Blastocatellia bacterium]|nr:hypothetical protein [Blastocatellia bacterium]